MRITDALKEGLVVLGGKSTYELELLEKGNNIEILLYEKENGKNEIEKKVLTVLNGPFEIDKES